jgi:micrococcal nuclease
MRLPLLLASIGLVSISLADRLVAATCDLPDRETATVATVEDGETLKLTDGRVVRLVGIKAPMPPLGWRGDDPWPLVDAARDALSRLATGAEVELGFGGRRADRHDQLLAQVFLIKDGERLWLQEKMVAKGLARIYSLADNRACIGELLEAETKARDKRLGMWGSWAYRIQAAEDLERLDRLMHTYQLVEGRIVAVGEGRAWIYLNFAEDWRRDFTIGVARKNVAAFADAGIDLKNLAGKTVRVRGWLQWRNGPMIEATHPEQLELLADTSGKAGL